MSYAAGDAEVDFVINDPDDVVASGLVARWQAGSGVTENGVDPTEWVDVEGALTISDADTSLSTVIATPSGGAAMQVASADGGMTGSTLTGFATGAADRSVGAVIAFDPFQVGTLGYCGFGYGAGANDQSFIVGVDGDGYATCDYRGGRLSTTIRIDDGFYHTLYATYESATNIIRFFVDGQEVLSEEKVLNTAATSIQVLRTFSGTGTPGKLAEGLIYDALLTPAQIAQNHARHVSDYITPTGAVAVSSVVLGAAKTATTLSFTFDATLPGTVDVIVTTTAGTPSDAQVKAGLDANGDPATYALIDAALDTENARTATGLEPETTYYLFGLAEDAAGNEVAFNDNSGVATNAAGVTTPALDSGTIDSVTQTTAVGTVDLTDGSDGTLYRYIAQASTFPTELQLLAGPSQPVTASGTQMVNLASLSSGADYWCWTMYVDGDGRRSNIQLMNGGGANGRFTTSAVVTPGSGDYDRAADDTATWGANLVGKLNALSDVSGEYIIDITGSGSNNCTLDGIQFANRRVILRPAPGNFGVTLTGSAPYHGYEFDNGVKMTGTTRLVNTQGLILYRLHFEGRDRLQIWGNCARTAVEQCVISGPPFSPTIDRNTEIGPAYFFQPGKNHDGGGDGVQNLTVRDCVLLYGNEALMYAFLANDCLFEGLMGAHHRADVFKVKNSKRTTYNRMWMPRQTNKGKGAHVDGWQIHGIRNEDLAVTNCIVVKGIAANEDSNPNHSYQTVWSDNSNRIAGFRYDGNVFCHSHRRMIKLIDSSGVTCNNNDFSRIRLGQSATQQKGGCPQIENGGSHTNNFGIGTSGNNFGSNPVRVVDTTTENPVDTDFDVRVNGGHHTGIMQNDVMDIGALKPPGASSQRHWDNGNPKGAWELLRGIFETGDALPPNAWPCCVILDTQFNAAGSLRPKYSGFDYYGNAT